MTIAIRAEVSEYTNRVLGVIKEKYGLKDKAEALDKFAHMFGEEFVEKELKEEVARNLINKCKKHMEKYGKRKMSLKELDKLTGM